MTRSHDVTTRIVQTPPRSSSDSDTSTNRNRVLSLSSATILYPLLRRLPFEGLRDSSVITFHQGQIFLTQLATCLLLLGRVPLLAQASPLGWPIYSPKWAQICEGNNLHVLSHVQTKETYPGSLSSSRVTATCSSSKAICSSSSVVVISMFVAPLLIVPDHISSKEVHG